MMQTWKLIAIFGPLLFVTYQTLTKFLPKTVSPFLVNAYASFVGLIVMLILHFLFSPNKTLVLNNKSLLLALSIGVLISLGNFLIIKAFNLGADQSTFTSLFYPLFIIYGLLFGLFIWHEKMNLIQAVGVLLSILGVVLVAYFRK